MAKQSAGELTISEFSRLGNLARMKKLSPERRAEIARKAAQARWAAKSSPDPNEPTRADLRPVSDKGTSIMLNSRRRPKSCHNTRTRKASAYFNLNLFQMENNIAVA